MKNLNLESFGVQEMGSKEMRETIGGSWFWRNFIDIGTAIAAGIVAIAVAIKLAD